MKRIGWIVLGLGALALAAEVIAAQYFSGRPIGEYLLYDRADPSVTAALRVAPEDLPVRAVMTAVGGRPMGARGMGGRPVARFDLSFGNGGGDQRIRFTFAAEKDLDTVSEFRTTQSFLLAMGRPGEWRLSMSDAGFRQFEVERITAELRAGARGPNIVLLAVGGVIAAIGAALLYLERAGRRTAG